MTALTKYARLEAAALWRSEEGAQRRDVIISIGEQTLTISDKNDRPLAHWALAALSRANPGAQPALYHPDGDPGETLEIGPGEPEMIEAIETLRRAISRTRPRKGRLRGLGGGLILASVLALAVFWLPGAVVRHTVQVVPQAKRAEIDSALTQRIARVAGAPCRSEAGSAALARLTERVLGGARRPVTVLREGRETVLALPGGGFLVNRNLIEDYDSPDVLAGYLLAADAAARERDPLRALLRHAGPVAAGRLLTTGALPPGALDAWAETLVRTPSALLPEEDMARDTLLRRFQTAGLSTRPFAYALDVTGEATLPLIEADPYRAGAPRPILEDGDWVRLQGICGET